MSQNIIKEDLSIPFLTLIASLLLIGAAWAIHKIMKKIPSSQLYGYSDAHFKKNHPKQTNHPGILEGLKLILTEPYVLGIFGLVACFEITNIIFDYQMQVLMSIETHNDINVMSRFMLFYTNSFQILSFIFALFGTTTLLKKFGVFKCLLIMPVVTLALALWLLFNPSLTTIFITMVALRGLQYGFNSPVREVLYIPTVKDIQFKSKAWIDSFGRTFSKSSGSIINLFSILRGTSIVLGLQTLFILTLSALWLGLSVLIGKKYNKTIKNNALIGCHREDNNIQ
jgi:AAA family ATP:ADP antiporter